MNFKNLEKCDNLKMHKLSILIKILSVLCFLESAGPVYYYLHLNLIKQHSNPFFFKKVNFFAFDPKNCGLKDNFSEIPLNFFPLKCTSLGKTSFRYYLSLVRKMSLKSDQLEILLGVVIRLTERASLFPKK